MRSLWQMSAESRCCVAFGGKRERERGREGESACVHNTRPRPIYKARATDAHTKWVVAGIRAASWAPLRPHKWMSVGEHVTGEARARSLRTSVSHSTLHSPLPPILQRLLSLPPALFLFRATQMTRGSARHKLCFDKIDLRFRWWTRQFSEMLL